MHARYYDYFKYKTQTCEANQHTAISLRQAYFQFEPKKLNRKMNKLNPFQFKKKRMYDTEYFKYER